MKVYNSAAAAIGHTPIVKLGAFAKSVGANAFLYAKMECFNPFGSSKDRVARAMIEDAFVRGELKRGGTIIEPTSGNTGIALAAVGVPAGLRVILTMPENMSAQRRALIGGYGGEIVETCAKSGMAGAAEKAKELKEKLNGVILDQFSNPANPYAHFRTTAPEIYRAMHGEADIFVAGIGTGGTITGVGRYLKAKNPSIRIYGVEPAASPLLSCGRAGAHKIQGIGANFKPANLDMSVVDGIITVSDEEAAATRFNLARTEGIFAGISSGAALCAAAKLGTSPQNAGKNIVVVLVDGGERGA